MYTKLGADDQGWQNKLIATVFHQLLQQRWYEGNFGSKGKWQSNSQESTCNVNRQLFNSCNAKFEVTK